jgi:hypothetical protein
MDRWKAGCPSGQPGFRSESELRDVTVAQVVEAPQVLIRVCHET